MISIKRVLQKWLGIEAIAERVVELELGDYIDMTADTRGIIEKSERSNEAMDRILKGYES